MVCFSEALGVEALQIYRAPWISILLGNDDHESTPYDWHADGNRDDDTTPHKIVKVFLDNLLPVERDWNWAVAGIWLCIRFQVDVCWWS